MKRMIVFAAAVAAVSAVLAAPSSTRGRKNVKAMAGNDDGPSTSGRAAKILVDQMPKTGQQVCLMAPSIQGGSLIGQCYKKPRQWIVLETKYTTYGTDTSKFLDQLTFTWHVLLETKSARENKGNKEKLPPYSYFTTAMTYFNIPAGSHASSVCLPPSYLERYGEPKAVGFEISNQNGDVLGGGTVSEIKGIANDTKFWEQPAIMDAQQGGGPMIERRQGLVDRSKTIWALVNPNDYETTMQ